MSEACRESTENTPIIIIIIFLPSVSMIPRDLKKS